MMYLILAAYLLPLIILTICVEVESFGWATTAFIASAAAFASYNWSAASAFVVAHYLEVALYFGLYLVARVAWTFAKWVMLLVRYNQAFKEAKLGFLKAVDLNGRFTIPAERLNDFKSWCNKNSPTINFRYSVVTGQQKPVKPRQLITRAGSLRGVVFGLSALLDSF